MCPTQLNQARVGGAAAGPRRLGGRRPIRCAPRAFRRPSIAATGARYEDSGLFPFTGEIESVTFTFGPSDRPTGMERLKLATRMD